MSEAETERIEQDKKLGQALGGLANNPHWEFILETLIGYMVQADAQARTLEGPSLYRVQGKAIFIEWFVKQADSAEDILARAMQGHSKLVRRNRVNGGIPV